MLVIFGFAVLLLAIGLVLLFAMFGELSARLAEAGMTRRSTMVRPLDKAWVGHSPGTWPAPLTGASRKPLTLLVLSSSCTSCADVATQLVDKPGHADWDEVAVLVSTANQDTGEDFVVSHGLSGLPHYVDEGGSWIASELNVRHSPTALVFRDGRLTAAYIFHDVAALRAKVDQDQRDYSQGQEGERHDGALKLG
jgi:hypothetical protein